MPYQIRQARSNDCTALSHIGQATFALASPPDSAPAAQRHYIAHNLQPEHFQAHLRHPHKRLLVVEEGGQVLGYSMLDLAPGEQLRPGGSTHRRSVEVGEPDRLRAKAVHLGCLDFRVAVAGDVTVALIIGKNKNHVRPCGGRRSMPGGRESAERFCQRSSSEGHFLFKAPPR